MLKRVLALLAISVFIIVTAIGCGGGGNLSDEEMLLLVSKAMGMAGGMLSYGAHVTIVVDPGTVSDTTTFSISLPPTPLPPAPAGKEMVPDTAYDLGPSGMSFAPHLVHVTFGYTVSPTLPPQNSLGLYKADFSGNTWTKVSVDPPDTTAHTVKADLNSFSTYAIFGDAATTFSATVDGAVFEVGTVAATQSAGTGILNIQVNSTGIDPPQLVMNIISPTAGTTTPIGPNFNATFIESGGARDQATAGSITITSLSATSVEGTFNFNLGAAGPIRPVSGAFKLPVTSVP